MSCVQIFAVDLRGAQSGRIDASVLPEKVQIDLPADFSMRFSKDSAGLTDINELVVDGVLPFEVFDTPVNRAVFIAYYSPYTLNSKNEYLKVVVLVDGLPCEFTRLYVLGRRESEQKWLLELRLPESHWIYEAQRIKLCELTGLGTAVFDPTNVVFNWQNSFPYVDGGEIFYYPTVDYGGWVDKQEPLQGLTTSRKQVAIEDHRPFFYWKPLLEAAFCQIGWSINCPILDTPAFRQHHLYILASDFYKQSNGGTNRVTLRNLALPETPVGTYPSPSMKFDAIDSNAGGNAMALGANLWSSGYHNTLPFASCIRFTFSGRVKNPYTTLGTLDLAFSVFEVDENSVATGEVLVSYDIAPKVVLAPNETKYVNISVECVLQPGQRGALTPQLEGLSTQANLLSGSLLTIYPCNKTLHRGDTYSLAKVISCKYTVLELFKGLLHLMNGRIETNFTTRTVSVYPYRSTNVYGTQVQGFIDEVGDVIDIENEVAVDSAYLRPIRATLKRFTQLQFKNGKGSDAYIASLGETDAPHSRKITNGRDLEDDTEELENPFFEPTLEAQVTSLKPYEGDYELPAPYLPRLWDNTSGQISYDIGPRILFGYGLMKQKNPKTTVAGNAFYALPSTFLGVSTFAVSIAYSSQRRTAELEQGPANLQGPRVDGSVVYGQQASDLFLTFWLGLTTEERQGFMLEVLWRMNYKRFKEMGSLRKRVGFTYQGRPIVGPVQSIRDMDCCGEVPTPVQVFLFSKNTECCDLPCSCVFRTCTYYQDFGPYIRQSTLDQLEISSFKIDGIEQLSFPATFGVLNIVEIAGWPYVTNLVDTLNDLNIPYFSFAYSEKLHPIKKARYFRIKHPACQRFEIIISGPEGEVYRYTELIQETRWFTNYTNWEPFGYSGDGIDEPEDCETTREY